MWIPALGSFSGGDLTGLNLVNTIDISWLDWGLQVVYLWRHVSSTAPPFILWWWNLEILFGPLHRSSPFIGELRCQAIQMKHGLILYSIEDPKRSLYCKMSVIESHSFPVLGSLLRQRITVIPGTSSSLL
jgi:hypothetical protein